MKHDKIRYEKNASVSCSVVFDLWLHGLWPTKLLCLILQARILEWTVIPFSRGSSQARDQTRVPCSARGFLPSEPPGTPQIRFACVLISVISINVLYILQVVWASQAALVVKNPPASAGDTRDSSLIPGLGRSPGAGNSTPLWYCCWEIQGQRSLAGYSPWGRKESDTTKHAHTRPTRVFHIFSTYMNICYFPLLSEKW